jgi:predicted RNA binding protein YcfA (HicA-like mRNA interferase family)
MTTMSTSDTLDFLADLAQDGLREIRRELFRQLDATLLGVLAAEFPMASAPVVAESDRRSDDEDVTCTAAPASRPGRLSQFTSARVSRDLRRLGFVRRKSTSGHRIFVHPTKRGGHVAVPHHSGDLRRGTLTNILRQASEVLGNRLVIDPQRSRLVLQHS